MAALSANFARVLGILGLAAARTRTATLGRLANCDTVRRSSRSPACSGPSSAPAATAASAAATSLARRRRGVPLVPQAQRARLLDGLRRGRDQDELGLRVHLGRGRPSASNDVALASQEGDAYNLTISVDRPTFVNFLNANRTFFMNAQLFLGYLPDYNQSYTSTARSTRSAPSRSRPATSRTACCPRSRSSTTSARVGGVLPQVTYRINQDFSVPSAWRSSGSPRSPTCRSSSSLPRTSAGPSARGRATRALRDRRARRGLRAPPLCVLAASWPSGSFTLRLGGR